MWTKRQLACEYRGVSTFPSPWFASEELHTEGATEGLLRAKGRPARRTLAIWGPYRGGCGPWTWPWPGAQPFAADSFAPPTPPGVSRRVEQPGQGTGVSLHDAAEDGEPGSGACRPQELCPVGRQTRYRPSHLPRSAPALLHPARHLRTCLRLFRLFPRLFQRWTDAAPEELATVDAVSDPWKRQSRIPPQATYSEPSSLSRKR